MNSQEFPSRMNEIVEPKREIRFVTFTYQGMKKISQLEKFLQNTRKMTKGISKWSQSRKFSKCAIFRESRGNFDGINIKKF